MGSSPTPGTKDRVVSASRRTDLPRWYLPWLKAALKAEEARVVLPYGGRRTVSLRPEEVHTLVLWSKDFSVLLADTEARALLGRYGQVVVHFTVTGLGGTGLEPGAPALREALDQLPRLVELVGTPERVVARFDPIVHWWEGNRRQTNLAAAEPVFRACARNGIREVRTSFATLYGKVLRRAVRWHDPSPEERTRIALALRDLARTHGVRLSSCSDPALEAAGIPRAPCIDGSRLTELHPDRRPASTRRDRGQRPDCLCTEGADIGSYTMVCPGGCLYCYARPAQASPSAPRGRRRGRTLPRGPTAGRPPSARASGGSESGGARGPARPRGGGAGAPS